tara:strand:- start:38567 stop:38914 length:348 start_codon:yes stop_codon:yes gene_type:complete
MAATTLVVKLLNSEKSRVQEETMAFIITEPCEGVCDTSCVNVCPVDCIHPTKEEWPAKGYEEGKLENKMLYINPEECIDCGACEPACPVQAIFPEDEVPEKWESYIKKNYEYYGL